MSYIPVICTFCHHSALYLKGEENPFHKIRLLIYIHPPQDLYFCNESCLFEWLKIHKKKPSKNTLDINGRYPQKLLEI